MTDRAFCQRQVDGLRPLIVTHFLSFFPAECSAFNMVSDNGLSPCRMCLGNAYPADAYTCVACPGGLNTGAPDDAAGARTIEDCLGLFFVIKMNFTFARECKIEL